MRATLARWAGAIWRRLGLSSIGENTDEPGHDEHLAAHCAFARWQERKP